MVRMNKLSGLAVILGLALFASVMAYADEAKGNRYTDYSKMTPSATMEFEVTSIKLIAGAAWGSGTLHYQGKSYPLKVSAATAGGVGYRSIKGTGKVFELKQLEDFSGVYSGGTAGATVGKMGAGVSTIENGKGVVVQATVTDSEGAQLSVGLGGLEIEIVE